MKILIIEDNQLLRKAFSHHLAGQGYDIVMSAATVNAADAVRLHKPDVILTTSHSCGFAPIFMPCFIRHNCGTGLARAFVMLAEDDGPHLADLVDAGLISGYYVKGFPLEQLTLILSSLQGNQRRSVSEDADPAHAPL